MSIISNIKSIFKATPKDNKSNQALHFFNQTIGANRSTAKQVEQLLSNYSFICIDKIADLTSQQEFYIGTFNKELQVYETVEDENNFAVKLLNEQSLTMQINFRNLIKLVVQWLYAEGNAYIWARQSNYNGGIKAKYPFELILLPAREVMINAGQYNLIDSYSLTLNNKYITIPANEVIHIKSMSIPFGSNNEEYYYKGVPKYLQSLKDVLNGYSAMLSNANKELLRQGVPNIVLSNEKNGLSQEEIDEWQEVMKRRYPDETPMIVGLLEGTTYDRMDIGNNILAQNTGAFAGGINTEYKQLITSTFGLPLDFLNGNVAYTNNYKELKATIYEQTINPLTQTIIEAFTNHYKQFDNGIYSMQYTPYSYQSLNDKLLIINTLASYNWISGNEARDMVNLEIDNKYDIDEELEELEIDETIDNEIEEENEIDVKSKIDKTISETLKKKVV